MNFDGFSQTYEDDVSKLLPSSAGEHQFYLRAKVEAVARRCKLLGVDSGELDLLDVGCGVGLMHRDLVPHFGSVSGIDVSTESIDIARSRNPTLAYFSYDGEMMPFAPGSFDAVLLVCTLHHVPPCRWRPFLGEIRRVLKPGGYFFVAEHNPWNPATRYIVSRCAFDADAVLLSATECRRQARAAGFSAVSTDYILFLPFKYRLVRVLEEMFLRWVPMGAQYVSTFQKNSVDK